MKHLILATCLFCLPGISVGQRCRIDNCIDYYSLFMPPFIFRVYPNTAVVGCQANESIINVPGLTSHFAKPWWHRSNDPVTLRGTLNKFAWYEDTPTPSIIDYDANFHITPDPEFSYLAERRSKGFRDEFPGNAIEVGPNPKDPEWGVMQPGLVEAELATDRELVKPTFQGKEGMRIEVKGWWVQDYMHNNKTEIHPIISLVAQVGSGALRAAKEVFVLVGQDNSGRFCVSNEPLKETIRVPLNYNADEINLGSYNGGVYEVEFLKESAVLDLTSGGPLRSTLTTIQTQNELELSIEMPPPDATKAYFPIYIAKFNRALQPAFKDEITYSIVPLTSTCKALEVKFKAHFDSPLFNTHRWNFGNQAFQTTSEFNQTIQYAPCNGANRTSWDLQATARSHAFDFRPPASDIGKSDFLANKEIRTFSQKKRTYSLTPSSVAIVPSNGAVIRTFPAADGRMKRVVVFCDGCTNYTASVTLAPLQTEDNAKWTIIKDQSTYWTLDAANTTVSTPTFEASLNPGGHSLKICSKSPLCPTDIASVAYNFDTPVGENPNHVVESSCCKSNTELDFSLLWKAEAVAQKCGVNLSKCLNARGGWNPPIPLITQKDLLNLFNDFEYRGTMGKMITILKSGRPLDKREIVEFKKEISLLEKVAFDKTVDEKFTRQMLRSIGFEGK